MQPRPITRVFLIGFVIGLLQPFALGLTAILVSYHPAFTLTPEFYVILLMTSLVLANLFALLIAAFVTGSLNKGLQLGVATTIVSFAIIYIGSMLRFERELTGFASYFLLCLLFGTVSVIVFELDRM
jgi:hypothetical protein